VPWESIAGRERLISVYRESFSGSRESICLAVGIDLPSAEIDLPLAGSDLRATEIDLSRGRS
jgi:hypothetical protein